MRRSLAAKLKKDAAQEDSGNALAAFTARLANKPEPKKGMAPAKEGYESLPIRKGGAVRDGSLGDLRAAWQTLVRDPRTWETEEFGLLGFFAVLVGTTVWGYNTYVNPPEYVPKPRNTPYERCLSDAYSFSEENICKVK